MRTLTDLIKEARQLPAEDRQRLLETLEESLQGEENTQNAGSPSHPYARTLRLAGSFHSEFHDVSSEKYKHLSQAILDESQ